MLDIHTVLEKLRLPFHPSLVRWLPGAVNKDQTKAMAMAYADVRGYQNRLDEVCGMDWSITFTPWGDRLICHLTIAGVTRSSTGEPDSQSERSEIGGTATEAQAFKRACAMFGLGRYLYQLPTAWVEYDASTKKFSERGLARLEGIIVQHYNRTMGAQGASMAAGQEDGQGSADEPTAAQLEQFEALGAELYADEWTKIKSHNAERITGGATTSAGDLSAEQIGKLIEGMKKLQRKRQTLGQVAREAGV